VSTGGEGIVAGREGKRRIREREGEEKGRDGREEGTVRGPQFEKSDPSSSDGWLRACAVATKF